VGVPFCDAKRDFEQAYVRRLLVLTAGNVTRAADLAGKARKDFYALMARNQIDPGTFRSRQER
jgi:two-component system response regulator GlrR